jgi:hypothetical protein
LRPRKLSCGARKQKGKFIGRRALVAPKRLAASQRSEDGSEGGKDAKLAKAVLQPVWVY